VPVTEAKTELVDHAMRIVAEDAKDAFCVLDKNGTIYFLNNQMVKLTGIPKDSLTKKNITDILEAESDLTTVSTTQRIQAHITTSDKSTPVELQVEPIIIDQDSKGTVIIVKKTQGITYLNSLEAVSSHIQQQSSQQKIYETLGKELSALSISAVVLLCENGKYKIDYHTLHTRKIRLTEFMTGISLSTLTVFIHDEALKKIKNQNSLFFQDTSTLLESAAPEFSTSQMHWFFSANNLTQGIAVPLVSSNKMTGILILFSDEFTPQDALVVSALGAHVSAALERAYHYEQMVKDLKALEDQITTRTKELEKVKQQMESIVQSSADAIIATDLDGNITFANKGVEALLGCTEQDILGEPIIGYYAKGKKDAKRLRNFVIKNGKMENMELDFHTKDGHLVHTLASFSLLKNENRTITGIMGVIKDVTEQKRLQKTLESLNTAAFKIQKSRTREEIFRVTAEELSKFDFYVAFLMLNKENDAAHIVYITDKMQKILNTSNSSVEIPLTNVLHEFPIKKREAVYIEDVSATIKKVNPLLYQTSKEKLKNFGIDEKRAIIAPLIMQGETTGLLGVISDYITSRDISSIIAFANQVSTALENARLLEESTTRADELAKNLERQQVLRELNTNLFLAQSQDEILDAAIEGIHTLGGFFSNISLVNEERTHATIVRFKMERSLLEIIEKIAGKVIPGFSILGYDVPIWEKDNVYHEFFEDNIPLVSSNVEIEDYLVIKTDLSRIYAGFATKSPLLQKAISTIAEMLPYKSVMVFPISVQGETVGTLTVAENTVFSQEDFDMMRTVGEMVSGATERVVQSEKLTETLNELKAVQRINTLLNMGAPLEQVLSQISASIEEVYHYQFAVPLLLDPSRRYLTFHYVPVPPEYVNKINDILGQNLKDFTYPVSHDPEFFDKVIKERKCLIRNGFEDVADRIPLDELSSTMKELAPTLSKALGLEPKENSIMIAPLPYGEEVIGILLLGHKKSLTEEEFQNLEYFLDQVGIAMAKSEVEHRLRQSLQELRELDRMKSEFIDIASHELRTPLTTLKLYLEMMSMDQYGKLSQSLRDRITVMKEGVNRLEEIINQTLVASRLIKNKLELEERALSLVDITADVVRQLRPLWKAKNQNIFIESVPDLCTVNGDKKAVSTVLSNLVDNAVRYSPENTEIYIKFNEHPTEVECIVQDQGSGISPEHWEKIFDEFYIVPSETEYARMDGRTGLGLFIAKGIVERHEGKIWVESTVGEGSRFHVIFPKE
jgi:PAS domain S-box-containing protein